MRDKLKEWTKPVRKFERIIGHRCTRWTDQDDRWFDEWLETGVIPKGLQEILNRKKRIAYHEKLV